MMVVAAEIDGGIDGLWKAKYAFHSPWKTLRVSHIPTVTTAAR